MTNTTPELFWKVRVEEGGKSARFEFLTAEQISIRARVAGVMNETNAYVKIGTANFEPLALWKRRQRGR